MQVWRAVDNLLRMTSGIQFDEANSIGPLTGALLFEAYDSAAFAASFPQGSAPDLTWNYSTPNYNLAQYNLRQVLLSLASQKSICQPPQKSHPTNLKFSEAHASRGTRKYCSLQ